MIFCGVNSNGVMPDLFGTSKKMYQHSLLKGKKHEKTILYSWFTHYMAII